jgi:hypothetical protein
MKTVRTLTFLLRKIDASTSLVQQELLRSRVSLIFNSLLLE